MMRGRLYIDSKDAYAEYGVFLTEQGLNEMIAYAPLKAVNFNDWQEQDGIEPDLSNPVLDTKDGTMKFAWRGSEARLDSFIAALADGAYHTFEFVSLLRTFRLRMVSCPNLSYARRLGFLSLRCADDFPLDGYEYAGPQGSIPEYRDYLLDSRPFTDYGVRVLQGTLDEVLKPAEVKANLLRNIKSVRGALYDGARVTYKSKEVKIRCLMRARTLGELWRNYDALLYDLTRPGERSLYCAHTRTSYPCYYKSCAVSAFYPTAKIWLEFTLTLCFTRFRNIRSRYLRKVSEASLRLSGGGDMRFTI